jgi:hypothetical protein
MRLPLADLGTNSNYYQNNVTAANELIIQVAMNFGNGNPTPALVDLCK